MNDEIFPSAAVTQQLFAGVGRRALDDCRSLADRMLFNFASPVAAAALFYFHAAQHCLCHRSAGQRSGAISSFQALTTALAATIGTGNIAGVAAAITLGGPGAVFGCGSLPFWVWLLNTRSRLGCALSSHRAAGDAVGGPMYFLAKGLNSQVLAALFALFGSLAAFGIGNMVQANSVAAAMHEAFNVSQLQTGLIMAAITAAVIIGGISRIAAFTEKLVPLMAAFYSLSALIIIFLNRQRLPLAFSQIISGAFTGRAAVGGFAGASVLQAFRFGVARGIFTNEAGLGSASIAHAAARTDHPARQGLWGMFEVFFDTHISCTLTALTILVTEVWHSGLDGAALTAAAFNAAIPGVGGCSAIALVFLLFPLISWSYYGEKCLNIWLVPCDLVYRLLWIILIPWGLSAMRAVWSLADTLNGLMAVPNLLAYGG